MKDGSASRWNARHAAGEDRVPPPAEVLTRFVQRLPASGRALDLACGRAGNGEWLARRGLHVTAVDVSDVVIQAILDRPGSGIAEARVHDILLDPLPRDAYDTIVVARFLERGACAGIAAALRPGGTLFYQTFSAGMRNPAFQLLANELPALFATLDTLHYLDPPAGDDGRAEAMLVARNPRPPS